mgnify:CR=1 FL=1
MISPFRAQRNAARARFLPGRFIEVFVDTPLSVCVVTGEKLGSMGDPHVIEYEVEPHLVIAQERLPCEMARPPVERIERQIRWTLEPLLEWAERDEAHEDEIRQYGDVIADIFRCTDLDFPPIGQV